MSCLLRVLGLAATCSDGGSGSDYPSAPAVDVAGNVLISGSFSNTINFGGWLFVSAGSQDIFLAKFDSPLTLPSISSVLDVGNDQGRQVSLEWRRSGHDFLGDASQVTEYAVYRRIDPLPAAGAPPPPARPASQNW